MRAPFSKEPIRTVERHKRPHVIESVRADGSGSGERKLVSMLQAAVPSAKLGYHCIS